MDTPKFIKSEDIVRSIHIVLEVEEYDALVQDGAMFGSTLSDCPEIFHIVKDELLQMEGDDAVEHESTNTIIQYVGKKYGNINEIGELVFTSNQ